MLAALQARLRRRQPPVALWRHSVLSAQERAAVEARLAHAETTLVDLEQQVAQLTEDVTVRAQREADARAEYAAWKREHG